MSLKLVQGFINTYFVGSPADHRFDQSVLVGSSFQGKPVRTSRNSAPLLDSNHSHVENQIGMIGYDIARRSFLSLLMLSVVVAGFLGVLPHDHDIMVTSVFRCENSNSPEPSNANVGKAEAEHTGHVCLLCSIRPTSLFSSVAPPWRPFVWASRADLVVSDVRLTVPRRWSLPLRGPPVFA